MHSDNSPNLLRRTAAVFSAVAAFCIAAPAAAQGTVSLSSGGSCTYSGMSIAPNGNVVVTCQSTIPGAPGTISLSGPSSVAMNSSGAMSVNRPGGFTGATNVAISVNGGCGISTSSVAFADGDQAPKPFTLNTPGGPGACTVAISVSGAAALGAPSSMTVTVTAATQPDPVVNNGNCPAVPGDAQATTLVKGGRNFLKLAPNQIGYAPLPSTAGNWASGQIKLSETSNSPDPATTEISISKCPGVIVTTPGCYAKSPFKNLNDLTWMERPSQGVDNPTTAAAFGICYAAASQGPWYVNVRYVYNGCSLAGGCAFNISWSDGAVQ
jgi:hypothetical protein